MDLLVDPGSLPHTHNSRGYVVIIVVVVMLSVASLSVALRFYTRAYLLKRTGLDDYLALLALVLAIATGVSQCVNTRNGLGKNVWDLEVPGDLVAYLKNFYVNIAFYNAGLLMVKLAFLTQYYRVLVLRRFQIVCIVAMILVGAWGLSQLLIGLFICLPIAGFWDMKVEAECIPTPLQWYITAVGNITSDIIIFILPLPVLVRLKLPRAQRLSLVCIFSLGFFTCAISVIRIKYLKQGSNFSYENVEASSWSITELCSGVICVCLPTLRPFVSGYVPKLASRIQRSSRGYMRHTSPGGTERSEGRRHTHENIKESDGAGLGCGGGGGGAAAAARGGRGNRFRHPNDLPSDSDFGTGGDVTDAVSGLRDTREAPYDGSSTAGPVALDPARGSGGHPAWMQPAVTTTISTGGGESRVSREQPSSIYITHDIMLEQVTPSAV